MKRGVRAAGLAVFVFVLGASAVAYAMSCLKEDPEVATLRLKEKRVDGETVDPSAIEAGRTAEIRADGRDDGEAPAVEWIIPEKGAGNWRYRERYVPSN